MNKERILAARKRLKEFQRNKKDQTDKNALENTDTGKNINEGKTSLEQLSNQDIMEQLSPNVETNESTGSNEAKTKNINVSSDTSTDVDLINNYTTSAETTNNHNTSADEKLSNECTKAEFYNNSVTDNDFDESSCLTASQMIGDQNNYQSASMNQYEYFNLVSNISDNSSSSLQKEKTLQMTNVDTDISVNDKNLEEPTLTNTDLEQKNQILTCHLEEQKKVISQLHVEVSQYTSRISELQTIITNKDDQFEAKLLKEINPLKEQLQLDAQRIGILQAEIANLTATNSQCHMTIKQKTEQETEMYVNFRASEQKIFDLEEDLAAARNNMEEFTKSYQHLQANYEEIAEKVDKLKKENEDFELEVSELRQKFNHKSTELKNVQQELQEKCALLSLSELRIQQLSNLPNEMTALEAQHQTTKVLEQQLSQMKEALESMSGEKDETSKKYQNYVQQLDERHTKLLAELEALKKVITDSEIREQKYIQSLSELEQQLQKEKSKSLKPNDDQIAKIKTLTKSIDNLVLEQENLQSLLNEKDNAIETLQKDLSELQDIRDQNIEASKLATALQSEQLGASRAVLQNQQLKKQLNEMNDAFIALSNTKLDLTERVQAERSISKQLNAQLNDLEQQIEELREQLSKKELALDEYKKEKLQVAQIEDQIQHYQAQSYSANTLQQELQTALITIENLKKENQLLQAKFDELKHKNPTDKEISQEFNKTKIDDDTNVQKSEEILETNTVCSNNVKIPSLTLSENNVASVPESLTKLEMRFKETMEKIAELTDEKQRLEHLVLQLQGETETIEEYVTLYQKQRTILQEKAKEREYTFHQLLEQRNQQQEQLHKLKVLVTTLLKSKDCASTAPVASVTAEANLPVCDDSAKQDSNDSETINKNENKVVDTGYQTDKTTSQILDLLTEIKDCNNECILKPNIHPCPWCSGKLITV